MKNLWLMRRFKIGDQTENAKETFEVVSLDGW